MGDCQGNPSIMSPDGPELSRKKDGETSGFYGKHGND
jgi:hypothetical protein